MIQFLILVAMFAVLAPWPVTVLFVAAVAVGVGITICGDLFDDGERDRREEDER